MVNALSSSRLYSTHSPETDRVRVDILYHNVVNDETVGSALAGDDLVAKMWVDIVAQVATSRGQNAMLSRSTKLYDPVANICFVLEYPAGRKEGGCRSQTENYDRTSDGKKVVTVTATIVTRHWHAVVPNSVLNGTTLTSHSQPDNSIERVNRTITEALRQCIHPPAKQTIILSLIRLGVCASDSSTVTEHPSSRECAEFALRKKVVLRATHDSTEAIHAKSRQTRDTNQNLKRQVIRRLEFGVIVCSECYSPTNSFATRER